MKYIREGRIGRSKGFKTGAVVGTYPKPMLVLMYDEAGLDVIPSKGQASQNKDDIVFDVVAEEIVYIKPSGLAEWIVKPMEAQPKILCVDFTDSAIRQALMEFKPQPTSTCQQDTINVVNLLANKGTVPWKTVVLDPATRLQDAIFSHISAYQSDALKNAMVWASMIGGKLQQIVGVLCSVQAHVVVTFHTSLEKDEKSGEITEVPLVFGSKSRAAAPGLFSQWLYATKQGGKPVVWTTDQGFVKGIGCRWPAGLPSVVQPDFKSIYGKEVSA